MGSLDLTPDEAIRHRALLTAREIRAPGAVARISEPLWQREFGADPAVLGRPIEVGGRAGRRSGRYRWALWTEVRLEVARAGRAPDHSALSVMAGSMRAAFCDGSHVATKAAVSTAATTTRYVDGSVADTP